MYKYLMIICFLFSTVFGQEWYVKGGLGINYMKLPSKGEIQVEMNTGLYAHGTVGYQFNDNLRSEIEGAYRTNKGSRAKTEVEITHLDGTLYQASGMINLLLDFPFQKIFIFSIGAGVGLHRTDGQINAIFSYEKWGKMMEVFDVRREGFASQGIFGVRAAFSDKISGGLEYRHWKALECIQCDTLSLKLMLLF